LTRDWAPRRGQYAERKMQARMTESVRWQPYNPPLELAAARRVMGGASGGQLSRHLIPTYRKAQPALNREAWLDALASGSGNRGGQALSAVAPK
jgi:hypothetical protein